MYSVPSEWYRNCYQDQKKCCSAARSFSLLHENKTEECWLFIHGYRGYPGEMVRPAQDLFEAGFDVFVPRLPGHGTCGKDFIASHSSDWLTLCRNAVEYLKERYRKVHLLGHSMGSSIAALLGCGDPAIGKMVYVSPSFENLQMKQPARMILKFLSVFTPKVRCKWHLSHKYHQHYENAPCDEEYLGEEYWKWYFTRQLIEYYKLMKDALKSVSEHPHEHLIIYPMLDKIISEPSVALLKEALGSDANIVSVPTGTHSILYDKDPAAENTAVEAVIKFAKEKSSIKM